MRISTKSDHDVGLYVHVPFCETKCGYCDFYSIPLKGRSTDALVDALVAELGDRLRDAGVNVQTVFVGGGTPTLLPDDGLKKLFGAISEAVSGCSVSEFTVEANPATVTDETMRILVDAGVNRVSMGAQSWHQAELDALERLHSPGDIVPSVETVRRHGVSRINLDLIFGIGGQTIESWAESLRMTIELGLSHISTYGLTYEPETRLTAQRDAGRIVPCEDELEAEMYQHAIATLESAGYEHYEISNFAQPGERCRHNEIYWRNESYVAVGPSAAGFCDGVRYKNVPDLGRYIAMIRDQGHAEIESERITGLKLAAETLMMQIRLKDGISLPDFQRRTGVDLRARLGDLIERYVDRDWIECGDDFLRLTPAGRLITDSFVADSFERLQSE
jgi:oxygen-independent coproporphyrinogen III oxidase